VSLLGIPAIWIPLPWSSRGEQETNAQYHATSGASRIIKQKDLTSDKLLAEIDMIMKSKSFKVSATRLQKQFTNTGAKNLVAYLQKIYDQKTQI